MSDRNSASVFDVAASRGSTSDASQLSDLKARLNVSLTQRLQKTVVRRVSDLEAGSHAR
ncbi:MAG: hypothetical protein AAGI27_04905 [Pseudomonadota bacterium]